MKEICCLEDIKQLKKLGEIPSAILEVIDDDFKNVKDWADEDNECSLEEFNTHDYNYAYIAVFMENEPAEEYRKIGLTEGLKNIIPEAAANYYAENEKWTRLIVIVTDSLSLSIYLKNCDMFDRYVDMESKCSCKEEPF